MFAEIASLPGEAHAAIALVFGLLVGSFLNVVIFRYPNILFHEWTVQSREWLKLEPLENDDPPSLSRPASHCRQCKAEIKAWQNVPVISFLLLRGKCKQCGAAIGWRYPIVELLSGVLSAFVVWKLGWTLAAAAGVLLTWVLLVLAFIDMDHQLLPDEFVFPTLWLGLGLSLFGVFTDTHSAIIGAIAGYLSFWLVFQIFKLLTGKEGMGYGDFKLLALFGAWLGWQYLPQIVFISTLVGSVIGVIIIQLRKNSDDTKIPFGPYIAFAGWLAMLFGDQINQAYLTYAGF